MFVIGEAAWPPVAEPANNCRDQWYRAIIDLAFIRSMDESS